MKRPTTSMSPTGQPPNREVRLRRATSSSRSATASPTRQRSSVDNSGGPSQGSSTSRDGTIRRRSTGTIVRSSAPKVTADRSSTVAARTAGCHRRQAPESRASARSTGAIWVLDGEVIGSPGGDGRSLQVSALRPATGSSEVHEENRARRRRRRQHFAVDSDDQLLVLATTTRRPLKEDITQFDDNGNARRSDASIPDVRTGFATNPVNGDVLAVLNGEEITFRRILRTRARLLHPEGKLRGRIPALPQGARGRRVELLGLRRRRRRDRGLPLNGGPDVVPKPASRRPHRRRAHRAPRSDRSGRHRRLRSRIRDRPTPTGRRCRASSRCR